MSQSTTTTQRPDVAAAVGTVTAITPLPGDPNRRQIRVDGRVVATLSAADVESLDLAIDQAWTERTAEGARTLVEIARVRVAALAMLGRRAFPQRELQRRLTEKGHREEHAEAVVAELVADRWVDDEMCARSLAAEITRRRPAAPTLIVERLVARGIDPELARRVADETVGAEDPVEAAERLARSVAGAAPRTAAAVRRVGGLLMRRGFDEDTVTTVLDRLGLGRDEIEP